MAKFVKFDAKALKREWKKQAKILLTKGGVNELNAAALTLFPDIETPYRSGSEPQTAYTDKLTEDQHLGVLKHLGITE